MTPIDVALAMNSGVELPALECEALEIEDSRYFHRIAPEAGGRHHHRLRYIPLCEIAPMNRGRFVASPSVLAYSPATTLGRTMAAGREKVLNRLEPQPQLLAVG